MKPTMAKAHELATNNFLSRELISLSYDAQADQYKGIVKISGMCKEENTEEGRVEVNYYYVNKSGLDEGVICGILLAVATYVFKGSCVHEITEKLISEAKEPNKKPSTRKTAAKKPAAKKPAAEPVATENGESEEAEAAPVEAKAPAKKAPKKTPAKKAKTIAYDRNQTEHKKELGKILNGNFAGWNKDKDLAAKAKGLSESLVGTPIFDNKGEVLPEFTQAVIDGMSDSGEGDVDL